MKPIKSSKSAAKPRSARNFDYAALDENSDLDDVVELGRDAEVRGPYNDWARALGFMALKIRDVP